MVEDNCDAQKNLESLLLSELQRDDKSSQPRPLQEMADGDQIARKLLGDMVGTAENVLSPRQEMAQADAAVKLCYRDVWPPVEVTFAIMEMTRFDLVGMTFDVEFEVYLDWKDPQLCLGVHYEYVAERGGFEMVHALSSCRDDMHFFNPVFYVANSHTLPEEIDVLPQIIDEVLEEDGDEGRLIPWLRKKLRFAGSVSCRNVNARHFPFDIDCLYIKLESPEMSGLTSHGRARRIKFSDPVLSVKNPRLRKHRSYFAAARLPARHAQRDPNAKKKKDRAVVMQHMWRIDPDGGETHKIGEMRVIAVGGYVASAGLGYNFAMVLRRQWYPRYFFDILIYNLQTATAVFSQWVPFNEDMFASRMSITLTVLLTVVGVSTTRPPVIEKLPYSTLHDAYGQIMVFSVLLIGLGNLAIFVNCWGMYRDGLDYFDFTFNLEISDFKTDGFLGQWWCEEGKGVLACSASNLDCTIMLFTCSSLIALFFCSFLSSQMYRIDRILRVKHEIDSHGAPVRVPTPDGNASEYYSKLVMCNDRGEFAFVPLFDVITFARSVALLPGFWPFWLTWRWWRKSQNTFCESIGCCRRRFLDLDRDGDEDDSFHPVDAVRLLKKSESQYRDSGRQQQQLPSINHFHVKMSLSDTLRVLDVGSGEMGFYSYWLDEKSRRVRVGGTEGKLKYYKGMTFVDQFVEADDGPESLKNEILKRFQLSREERSLAPAHKLEDALRTPFETPEPPGDAEHQPLQAMDSLFCAEVCQKKQKIVLCPTGANRTYINQKMSGNHDEGRDKIDNFMGSMQTQLAPHNIELILYCPEDVDEALYELVATEWVVQHGDLNVDRVKLEKVYRILQRGNEGSNSNWQEVVETFAYLDAPDDLMVAFCRAGGRRRGDQPPDRVACKSFYKAFESSRPLLRALVRAKLFSGTLSAGSGSCQLTFRRSGNAEINQVYSCPVGNRTPLVKVEIGHDGDDVSILSKKFPRTRKAAMDLLGDISYVANVSGNHNNCRKTLAAWAEDGGVDIVTLKKWRELVKTCAEEREWPTRCRGMFVGISAIFYAAKSAGCADRLLGRDAFLENLQKKINELLEGSSGAGRELANLSLVYELVKHVFHHTAQIVCKRNWKVGEECGEPIDFVATWTLGMYLKHSGIMGQPLQI